MDYIFETRIEVRDYECDIQGIVNNANYLHYTEHTRHRFLLKTGVSFSELHHRGIDAVVARMKLEYKVPLHCDDIIVSKLNVEKEGVRWVFHHDLFRESDGKLCFRCKAELVVLDHGRLVAESEYDNVFKPYLKN